MRAAGVILARAVAGQWLYLLLRVYRYWDFPKGLVEAGEDDWEAAQRELQEETGIAPARIALRGRVHFDTEPYAKGKIARYFLASTEHAAVRLPTNPALGRAEHHEFRWSRYDEALELLVPRLQRILVRAHAQVVGAKA